MKLLNVFGRRFTGWATEDACMGICSFLPFSFTGCKVSLVLAGWLCFWLLSLVAILVGICETKATWPKFPSLWSDLESDILTAWSLFKGWELSVSHEILGLLECLIVSESPSMIPACVRLVVLASLICTELPVQEGWNFFAEYFVDWNNYYEAISSCCATDCTVYARDWICNKSPELRTLLFTYFEQLLLCA